MVQYIIVYSNYSVKGVIEEIQNDNNDIWHISSNTVELCTSMSNYELKERYNLHHCRVIITLKDLVKLEDVEEYGLLRLVYIIDFMKRCIVITLI